MNNDWKTWAEALIVSAAGAVLVGIADAVLTAVQQDPSVATNWPQIERAMIGGAVAALAGWVRKSPINRQ